MKNLIKFSLAIVVLLLFGCGSDNEDMNKQLLEVASKETFVSARPFIENKEQLNFDMDFKNPNLMDSLSDTEVAKLKAAVYRFYKNVEVIDGKYTTKLQFGKQIKISENFFKVLKHNLTQMNQELERLRKEGEKVDVQEVNQEYLNSLLE